MPRAIPSRHRPPAGFALVVTLSLMILLTVVSVGLLSLSAISLRRSSQGLAQAEARANARLTLMIAIGELQKQLGPDQRISASGAITDRLDPDGTVKEAAKNPYWIGVWDSWKAGPGEARGRHGWWVGDESQKARLPSLMTVALVDGVTKRPKPGQNMMIKPTEQDGNPSARAMFYFRKDEEIRPFFSSRWPVGGQARCLVFFHHDPETLHLRMHAIRDFR
jgi:hypothetical protein